MNFRKILSEFLGRLYLYTVLFHLTISAECAILVEKERKEVSPCMTAERFAAIEKWFKADPKRIGFLKAVSKTTSVVGYGAYAVLLIFLIITKNFGGLIRCIAVPAVTFILATLIRSGINAPRPYEKLGITPLIPKNTKGKSFPSRHVVCIVIIAAAWLYIYPPVGIFMSAVSLVIMIIRPLAGVHFTVDVIAGAVFAALCGIIGFVLIP